MSYNGIDSTTNVVAITNNVRVVKISDISIAAGNATQFVISDPMIKSDVVIRPSHPILQAADEQDEKDFLKCGITCSFSHRTEKMIFWIYNPSPYLSPKLTCSFTYDLYPSQG